MLENFKLPMYNLSSKCTVSTPDGALNYLLAKFDGSRATGARASCTPASAYLMITGALDTPHPTSSESYGDAS